MGPLCSRGKSAAKANLARTSRGTATEGWDLGQSPCPAPSEEELPMDTSSSSNTASALLVSCCVGLDVQTHLWLNFRTWEK